jgi:hypothetical protein
MCVVAAPLLMSLTCLLIVCAWYFRLRLLCAYVAYGQCANSVRVYVKQRTHLRKVTVRTKHVA